MLYLPRGKETEGEGREPDEEVGSQFSSRSCLALIWDGGGCEEKWGVMARERRGGGIGDGGMGTRIVV